MKKYNIAQAKEEIKHGFKMYMEKDKYGIYILGQDRQLPYFLVGPSGLGKTQICEQAANELGVGFYTSSMVHHSRQSAMGLPEIRELELDGKTVKYTEYTISEIIAGVYEKKKEGYSEGIILLDEYNCISEVLEPLSLAFLQSKVLGSSRLPKGWMIVIAGNPPRSAYNPAAREFGMAIMDRLRVMEIEQDFDSFYEYAKQKKFHTAVMQYLYFIRDDMYVCSKEGDETSIVTCRSWENLSDILYSYEKFGFDVDERVIGQVIKNEHIAERFISIYKCPVDISGSVERILEDNLTLDDKEELAESNRDVRMLLGYTCFRYLKAQVEKLHVAGDENRAECINKTADRLKNMLLFFRNVLDDRVMYRFYLETAIRQEAFADIMYSGSLCGWFIKAVDEGENKNIE